MSDSQPSEVKAEPASAFTAAPIVTATELGKVYCCDLLVASGYAVRDMLQPGWWRFRSRALREAEFWGIENLSFEVFEGETLGVLGAPQSGKSTLAALLSGLYVPDAGSLRVRAPTMLINSLTSGFRPMLTARENARFRAALLGVTRRRLETFVDHVLEFAELSAAADRPFFNLTPEEAAHLGSAVSFLAESPILVIDNVLPAGNPAFRDKCIDLLRSTKGKRTVIYITSKPGILEMLADRVLVLDDGRSLGVFSATRAGIELEKQLRLRVATQGIEERAIEEDDGEPQLEDQRADRDEVVLVASKARGATGKVKAEAIELDGNHHVMSQMWLWLRAGECVTVRMLLRCVEQIRIHELRVSLHAPYDALAIADTVMPVTSVEGAAQNVQLEPGEKLEVSFIVTIPELPKGYFGIGLTCVPSTSESLHKSDLLKVFTFGVRDARQRGLRPVLPVSSMTAVRAPSQPD